MNATSIAIVTQFPHTHTHTLTIPFNRKWKGSCKPIANQVILFTVYARKKSSLKLSTRDYYTFIYLVCSKKLLYSFDENKYVQWSTNYWSPSLLCNIQIIFVCFDFFNEKICRSTHVCRHIILISSIVWKNEGKKVNNFMM